MKISLVEDWRELHKKSTVIAASLFAAIAAFGPSLIDAWNMFPPELKAALPAGTARWVATAGFVLMVLFRYTKCEKKNDQV